MVPARRGVGRLEAKAEALDSKSASLAGTMIKALSQMRNHRLLP
jgi:hypothetical protein